MTRHLFRLIWNRKRQNFLLLVELFVAFLIVMAVSVLLVHVTNNARQPLGFSIDRVWTVGVHRSAPAEAEGAVAVVQTRDIYRQIAAAMADMPQIERSALAMTGPYWNSSWGTGVRLEDEREIHHSANRADENFLEVTGMRIVDGRWFSPDDEGASWEPVVLNRRLASAIFKGSNPIGQIIPERMAAQEVGGEAPVLKKRVVGVVEEFRQFGELSTPENYMFVRLSLQDSPSNRHLPEILLLRVRPGTTAAFEETLVRRLEALAPGWSFEVSTVEALRENTNRTFMMPIAALGTVAGALLLMVGFGLTGVVWQTVTQRTREFGLRRASGATAAQIGRQVLAELLTLTSLAIALGCVLVAQILILPLAEDLTIVPRGVFITGVALAAGAVYLVTVLSGLYPSQLATRVPPAEALHYE